jgi:hypothetical protein
MNPNTGVYSLATQGSERSGGDADPGERGECEDHIAGAMAEQPDWREQDGADDAGADEVEQEQRSDRRDDVEVGVVVLLGMNGAYC